MVEDCKWLSDEFSYVCCNGENREHVAEWCPYEGCMELCKYYEASDKHICQKKNSYPFEETEVEP